MPSATPVCLLYLFVQDKNIQQCFFTASAVYVICLKATEGLRGVVELEGWLLSIKVSHFKQTLKCEVLNTHISTVQSNHELPTSVCNYKKLSVLFKTTS